MDITQLSCPQAPGIRLWLVDLGEPASGGAVDARWLDENEVSRANRFRFARDAHRYRKSHQALRLLLAQCLGESPGSLRFQAGLEGKPRLVPSGTPPFNLSHSGSWALVAIGSDVPIGVDIEMATDLSDLVDLAQRNFSKDEYSALIDLPASERQKAFLRCWSRKEACLKAIGSGLAIEPHRFEAGLQPDMSHTAVPFGETAYGLTVVSLELPAEATAQAALAWLDTASAPLAL